MTADLTADEARQLTERITGQVSELLPLIREAFERRAWAALGHDSWEAYCDAELRGLRLPVADRQALEAELYAEGWSKRAIGHAAGVSHTQVARDLEDVERNVPRESATDSLGRQQPAKKPATAPSTPTPATPSRSAPAVPPASRPEPAAPPAPARRQSVDLDEDPEARAQAASKRTAEALVTLWANWETDPVRWVAENWRPDAYHLRDLPRVRDVFTPSGLRSIAKSLDLLADDLDQKGASL